MCGFYFLFGIWLFYSSDCTNGWIKKRGFFVKVVVGKVMSSYIINMCT